MHLAARLRCCADPAGRLDAVRCAAMTTDPCAGEDGTAARRWADALAAWAIPEEVLAAAPASPYTFDVGLFSRIADEAAGQDTPSVRVAREALGPGGSVLDVGCGGGAGSLPLVPPAGLFVGLDESAGMLAAFAERADAIGVAHTEMEGRWPDVADDAPVVDVVVCHNVFYNAADLGAFTRALTERALSRVVAEVTEEHPRAWMNPYWEHVHGLARPDVPTAADAVEVVGELGVEVAVERWERPSRVERTEEEIVAFVRQRLCVGPDRDPQLLQLVERFPPPQSRATATLWWSPAR